MSLSHSRRSTSTERRESTKPRTQSLHGHRTDLNVKGLNPALMTSGSNADYRRESRRDTLLAATAPEFDPEDIAHLAVLSRIVETLRFSSGPALLDTTITCENLIEAFNRHELITAAATTTGAGLEASASVVPTEVQQETADKLREVWDTIEQAHSGPLDVTYGYLFDFEFPAFPETTEEQRAALAALSEGREVVTQRMVLRALDLTEPDQTVDFLFASGAEAIPTEVYTELVACIGHHPQTHSFAPHFVEKRCRVGRRMLLMLPQLLALIVTLAVAPSVVNVEQRVLHENMMHWLNNDWSMGCSGGAASHVAANSSECDLLGMTVLDMNRPTQDAERYLRQQLPTLLWRNESKAAADTPLGGVFPVGVLTIRHVTEETGDDRCGVTGIRTTTHHLELPAVFGCGSEWAIQIPFSATRAEALSMTAGIELPPAGSSHDAIIAEFPGYSPTVRMTVYNRVLLTLPRGGGVWPKLLISPIEHDMHRRILPVLVVKLLGTLWGIAVAVRYRALARTFGLLDFDGVVDVAMAGLIAAAYGLFRSVADVPDGLLDVTLPHAGIDTAAERFNLGMSLFGAYCCLVIGSFVRFARDIAGLQVLVDILHSAALEIIGLAVLFLVWTTGFVFAAMMLFGQTTPAYSSFLPAARSLMFYYFGLNDITLLNKNHPQTGTAFFAVFQIFVVFFALNLLIAVLTAPLPHIKERTMLLRDTLVAVRSYVGDGRGWWARFRVEFGYFFLWPLINTALDAVPWAHNHYIRSFDVLDTFYTFSSKMRAADTVDKALMLLRLLAPDVDPDPHAKGYLTPARIAAQRRARMLWKSPLLDIVLDRRIVDNQVALAMVLVVLAKESQYAVVRDARLLRMLSFYDGFSTKMQRLLRLQDRYRPLAADATRSAAAHIDRAAGLLPSTAPSPAKDDATLVPVESRRFPSEGLLGIAREASVVCYAATDDNATTPPGEDPVMDGLSFLFEAAGPDSVDPFAFTRELRGQMTQAATFVFLTVVTVVVAAVFFIPFFHGVEYTAYLSEAVDAGIRDMPWRARCYDAQCVGAWSKNKTLLEVGDVDEFNTWLTEVLEEQLYRRQMDGLPFNDTNTTLFDPRVRLAGPYTIRQIRGRRTTCGSFNGPGTTENATYYAARAASVAEFDCVLGAASGFSTTALPAPPGGYPPNIGRAAYVERDVCPEDQPKSYFGRFALSYPCRGYSARIDGQAALREIIDSGWIDGDTRLVAITAVYAFAADTVEYTTLTELGEGGGGGVSLGFSFPLQTNSPLSELSEERIMFQVLVVLQLLFHAAMLGRYLFQRCYRGRPADEVSDLLPDFPLVAVGVAVLIFVVFQIMFPLATQPSRHNTAVALCAVVYFEYMLTAFLIFPLAALLSKKMKVLIATLHNTVAQILYVVPYFVVAFVALSYMAYVTWGRFLHEYSRLTWAGQEVIVMAFGGAFDIESLQAQRFVEAQFFAVFVFAIMLVALANLFLAMVTSASGDAQETPLATELAEGVLEASGARVVYGRLYNCALAFSVYAAKSATSGWLARVIPRTWTAARERTPVICTYRGRLLYPAETMLASFPPLRCNATLRFFCHDALPAVTYAGLMPYVLELRRAFEEGQAHSTAEDRKRERAETARYAASRAPPTATETEVVRFGAFSPRRLLSSVGDPGPDAEMDLDVLGMASVPTSTPPSTHTLGTLPVPLDVRQRRLSDLGPDSSHDRLLDQSKSSDDAPHRPPASEQQGPEQQGPGQQDETPPSAEDVTPKAPSREPSPQEPALMSTLPLARVDTQPPTRPPGDE